MNIFLSYSHKTDKSFITRLFDDLDKIHTLWKDNKTMDLGDKWRKEIEDGIINCDVFIFISDKYSRETNCFCENEIIFARNQKKRIFEIVLDDGVENILTNNSHNIDFKCIFDDEGKIIDQIYNSKIEELNDSLIRLAKNIGKINFDKINSNQFDKVDKYYINSINNSWVKKEYDTWLKSNNRFMVLTGNAGTGKSVLSAQIYKINENNSLIHFCDYSNEKACSYNNIIKSIVSQLVYKSKQYNNFIKSNITDEDFLTNELNIMFDKLLFKPLKDIDDNDIYITIIDGLDEIPTLYRKDSFHLIFDLFDELPVNYRFVFTTRPESYIMRQLMSHNPYRIDKIQDRNKNEIYEYVINQLKSYDITFNKTNVMSIINQSGSDFIYVKFIINELIERHTLDLSKIEFPIGMKGICEKYFDRLFNNDRKLFDESIKPLLEVICAAKEPIKTDYLQEILNISSEKIREFVRKLDMFLGEKDNKIFITHKSLGDWLKSTTYSDNYFIDVRNGNKVIIDWLVKNADCPNSYIKTFIIQHLVEMTEYDKLVDILNDEDGSNVDYLVSYIVRYVNNDTYNTFSLWFSDVLRRISNQIRIYIKVIRNLLQRGMKSLSERYDSLFTNCDKYQLMHNLYNFLNLKNQNLNVDQIVDLGEKCININELDNTTKADMYRILGDAYRERGDADKAETCYTEGAILSSGSFNSTHLDCECALIDLLYVKGDKDSVFERLEGLKEYIDFSHSNKTAYKFYRLRGNMYHLLNEYKLAFDDFMHCLDMANDMHFDLKIMESLNSLAEVDVSLNDAFDKTEEAKEFWEDKKTNKLEYGKSFYIDAGNYIKLEKYEKALKMANESFKILSDVGYASGKARAKFYSGIAKYNLNNIIDAYGDFNYAYNYYHATKIYGIYELETLLYIVKCCNLADSIDFHFNMSLIDEIKYLKNFPQSNDIIKEMDMMQRKKVKFNGLDESISVFLSNNPKKLKGYYNDNYVFEFNGERYILRFPIKDATIMDIKVIPENVILYALEINDIKAPRLVLESEYKGVKYSLHQMIDGETLEKDYAEDELMPDWIPKNIAKQMYIYHCLDIESMKINFGKMPWDLNINSFYDYIYNFNKSKMAEYWDKMRKYYDMFNFPKYLTDAIRNRSYELEDEKFVLCHSDIHRKNVIINDSDENELYILDWELALIGTPCYDISIHLHKMRYSPEQEELFIKKYAKHSGINEEFLFNQIDVFREIEEVKSVTIDIVRYFDDIIYGLVNDDVIKVYSSRYFKKLCKAYDRWNVQECDRLSENSILKIFMDVKNSHI